MWQNAVKINEVSVGALIRECKGKRGEYSWRTVGTAFRIKSLPHPTFLTCAHVLVNGHGIEIGKHALVSGFPFISSNQPMIAGVRIEKISLDIDAAIFICGNEASGTPIQGMNNTILPRGTPVASIGFPIPAKPIKTEKGGHFSVNQRFAAGFISSHESHARLVDTPYTRLDLLHYEMNMFCYPGLSGAPLFNLDGLVVGMVRGTALMENEKTSPVVVNYSFADRSDELLEFLAGAGFNQNG
ncbi:MAG: serine protease [Gammaproteobacteria bacterium]